MPSWRMTVNSASSRAFSGTSGNTYQETSARWRHVEVRSGPTRREFRTDSNANSALNLPDAEGPYLLACVKSAANLPVVSAAPTATPTPQ
jgi:hypothetical protein